MNDNLTARVERLASASLSRCGFFGEGASPLVVGVSGGPDSTALLYCLYRLRKAWDLKLHVAHLNHDFRGEEADADAEFVTNLALELDLPVTVEKQDPLAYQRERGISSFEQGARELRYAFLAKVATSIGATAVAVAHTADDLAETVLLHILRGAGMHGLRGMTELAPWPWPVNLPQLQLLRPLLEATKAETVAYCNSLGRSFRVDTGNALPRFTRNRVRQSLLPLLAEEYNPRIRESLVRLAHTASLELDFLETETDAIWPQVLIDPEEGEAEEGDAGSVSLHRLALSKLHPALRRMVLRRAYILVAGDARRLRESHLRAMADAAGRRSSGQTLQLPGGWRLHVTYDFLRLTKNPALDCPYPPLTGEYPVSLPQSTGEVAVTRLEGWEISIQIVTTPGAEQIAQAPPLAAYLGPRAFDPQALGPGLQIRSRQPGDRFQPLGMTHQKKLQDFFTDDRIPESWRDRVPLLVTGRGIVWVVGHRIAEWARVRAKAGDHDQVYAVTFQLS
ncbi:MAG: tRNA lysidine(34) synthetase TilS [Chloroflexi bacterium]|nr:tRNA lysidine(34) synthetase TilS [Chloroflexota bacterium]